MLCVEVLVVLGEKDQVARYHISVIRERISRAENNIWCKSCTDVFESKVKSGRD